MSDVIATVPREMLEALGVVERIGGSELVSRLAALFETSARQRAVSFADCLDSGDAKQLARVAHATKGSAAQLGAEPLRAAAAALEREAPDLDEAELRHRVDAINAEVQRTLRMLATYIQTREQ